MKKIKKQRYDGWCFPWLEYEGERQLVPCLYTFGRTRKESIERAKSFFEKGLTEKLLKDGYRPMRIYAVFPDLQDSPKD